MNKRHDDPEDIVMAAGDGIEESSVPTKVSPCPEPLEPLESSPGGLVSKEVVSDKK